MIFFTLGTERYPFHRLVQAAELAAEQLGDEEIIVQIGHHPDPPAGCRWIRWLPYPEQREHISKARVVVSHAGSGTILTCNELGRIPIVMPREYARGEHLDTHQEQLARRMLELERIQVVSTAGATLEAIRTFDVARSRLKLDRRTPPELAVSLARYLDAVRAQPNRKVPRDWSPRGADRDPMDNDERG